LPVDEFKQPTKTVEIAAEVYYYETFVFCLSDFMP